MALRGIQVLEMAGLAPAPFCGMLLSDFGASVTRVDGVNDDFTMDRLGRGKKSIAINLKSSRGQEIVRNLSLNCDVLLEGFRPGVMERLGMGPVELLTRNPKLIYARLTGYGQDTKKPLTMKGGHDINYCAIGGVLSQLGSKNQNPFPPINLLADFAGGGLLCAFGIVAALVERNNSGKGQIVDASMAQGSAYVASWLYRARDLQTVFGRQRGDNLLDGGAPFYNTYQTSDGKWMAVGALEPKFYAAFIKTLGLDPEKHGGQFDGENYSTQKKEIAEVFSSRTQAEWIELFAPVDACVTPVLDFDYVHMHPQNEGSFVVDEDNGFTQPLPAPELQRSRVSIHSLRNPGVGEHTVEVLMHDLGMKSVEIDDLIEEDTADFDMDRDRMNWMREEAEEDREAYLLGKSVGHNFKASGGDFVQASSLGSIPPSILHDESIPTPRLDSSRKALEDPMSVIEEQKRRLVEKMAIRARLQRAEEKPPKKKKKSNIDDLVKVLEKEVSKKKKKKKKGRKKKKEKRTSSSSNDSSDSDIDVKLAREIQKTKHLRADGGTSSTAPSSSADATGRTTISKDRRRMDSGRRGKKGDEEGRSKGTALALLMAHHPIMAGVPNPNDLVGTWEISLPSGKHLVEFEHGTTSGKRVIRLDGKTFSVEGHTCVISICPAGSFSYEYKLTVNGTSYKTFSESRSRIQKTWLLTIGDTTHRVVLEKDTLDIWVDGQRLETASEFVEDGTETHFEIGSVPAVVRAVTSGKRKEGIIHVLLLGEEIVPEATE
ncbi:unnamed protein product [Cyprideis torosa]|uniref:Uncharacterized protein n=1 Tax=Cyprideis torosa TaxID=163714 RepID=A0A7R8WLB6_9CRUS|nr:unnamed protein product [Cyprideis torosa]CAG0897818.1 unnamed protein product [Cyprideis torosa]